MKDKILAAAGFILFLLGAGAMDSESLMLPICMASAGMLLLFIEARRMEE